MGLVCQRVPPPTERMMLLVALLFLDDPAERALVLPTLAVMSQLVYRHMASRRPPRWLRNFSPPISVTRVLRRRQIIHTGHKA